VAGRWLMRFRLSWVSVAVGLLVAALFLVPTASRLDVREVVQADGTVEKRLETGYISLGSVGISHVLGSTAGWYRTTRLDKVNIALGVVIAAACALFVELGLRGLRRLMASAGNLPVERRRR
jgi:hypothetical protein